MPANSKNKREPRHPGNQWALLTVLKMTLTVKYQPGWGMTSSLIYLECQSHWLKLKKNHPKLVLA